jgi:hypothetical protein
LGTCCSQDQLIARFEALKKKLGKAAFQRKKHMENGQKALEKVTETITKLTTKKAATSNQDK